MSRGGTSTVRLALGPPGSGAQLRAEPESAVRADMGFRLRRATRAFSDFTFQLRLGLRALCGGAGRAGTGDTCERSAVKRYGFTAYSPSFHFRFTFRAAQTGSCARSLSNSNPYLRRVTRWTFSFSRFRFCIAVCSTFREPRYCRQLDVRIQYVPNPVLRAHLRVLRTSACSHVTRTPYRTGNRDVAGPGRIRCESL